MEAGEQLDQRRLAGTVLADETVHRAALDGQRSARERLRPPEPLHDAVKANDITDFAFCRFNHCRSLLVSS
ncbi:hypothetical protein D3C87_2080800 [compost metagenome]